MARRQRFHSPHTTYHVMLRGNDGQPIFFSEGDKSRMCLLLQQGVGRFKHKIEAFCFMSNHIHLAVRVTDISISKIVHHLAFCYTQYINRLYNRVGHLFQGRFKSVIVEDEIYLKELIRYIHLNPVRAGITFDPLNYSWSSHRAYMELDHFVWLSKDRVLEKFDKTKEHAINYYEQYILKGVGVQLELDFKTGNIKGILGESEFVDEVLTIAHLEKPNQIEFKDLIKNVCEFYNLAESDLCASGKNPKHSRARAVLACLTRENHNCSLEALGQFLKRHPSGLTKLANRLDMKSIEKTDIAKELQEIRQKLLTS